MSNDFHYNVFDGSCEESGCMLSNFLLRVSVKN